MKADRSKNRSDRYQYVLVESVCDPETLAEFAESDGITAKINSFNVSEEYFELKDKLKEAFWRIVNTELTERQREVIKLYIEGYTQMEIAKKLNINQSSVTKSINGNCDYKNGRKNYGGAKKKLKRVAESDPEIQAILKRMAEIREEEGY